MEKKESRSAHSGTAAWAGSRHTENEPGTLENLKL